MTTNRGHRPTYKASKDAQGSQTHLEALEAATGDSGAKQKKLVPKPSWVKKPRPPRVPKNWDPAEDWGAE